MDRLIATELGASTAELLAQGAQGVMVAVKNNLTQPVPLEDVVAVRRTVPVDHPWVYSARRVGVCLGDG